MQSDRRPHAAGTAPGSIGVLLSLAAIAPAAQFATRCVSSTPSSARPAPQEHPPLPVVRPRERNPYAKLFVTADAKKGQVTPAPGAPAGRVNHPTPKTICGLTVLEANPDIDRRMIVPAPSGDFKIRRLEPTICRNE